MSTYDYNTYSTVNEGALGILAGFGIIMLVIGLIALAIGIIGIIGQWKAFKKAGKGGWEAIIPIYNTVVACQISGVSPWWVLIYWAGSLVLNVIAVIGSLASMAISIYFVILLNVSVAKSFGKDTGFAVGLIFLGPIFWLMLGSKAQYAGPTPMNDVVMGMFNKNNTAPNNGFQQPMNNNFQQPMNNNVQQPMNDQSQVKFCTGCGYKVVNGERFCPGCGKEML